MRETINHKEGLEGYQLWISSQKALGVHGKSQFGYLESVGVRNLFDSFSTPQGVYYMVNQKKKMEKTSKKERTPARFLASTAKAYWLSHLQHPPRYCQTLPQLQQT